MALNKPGTALPSLSPVAVRATARDGAQPLSTRLSCSPQGEPESPTAAHFAGGNQHLTLSLAVLFSVLSAEMLCNFTTAGITDTAPLMQTLGKVHTTQHLNLQTQSSYSKMLV